MFDPNDVAKVCPKMATPEFMQDVLEAFETVLNYVERTQDDLDEQDYAEADKQRVSEQMKQLAYDQYIHGLS
jgi:hypothetical protein